MNFTPELIDELLARVEQGADPVLVLKSVQRALAKHREQQRTRAAERQRASRAARRAKRLRGSHRDLGDPSHPPRLPPLLHPRLPLAGERAQH